jgi:hypothetical protein
LVERNLAKVDVAGSSPVSRSNPATAGFFFLAALPSGPRRRSAKPLFVGSNPTAASHFVLIQRIFFNKFSFQKSLNFFFNYLTL